MSGTLSISSISSFVFGQSSIVILKLLVRGELTGVIPSGIGNLSGLRTLDLANNFLNGSLPDSLFNLKNLSLLDLSNNRITGRIPGAVGKISSLRGLDLSRNDFSGEIPHSLGELPNLDSFNVSYNNLSGHVPTNLSSKFNSSSFVGNIDLCGYNAATPCPVSPSPSPTTTPSRKRRGRKLSIKDSILIAAGALLVIMLVICCILLCCLLRRRKMGKEVKNGKRAEAGGEKGIPPTAAEVEASGDTGGKLVHFDGPMAFNADDLLCATAEIMGKSTYGTVYKATMEDGVQVAVKRLREKITKGQRDFETEVNELGKIRHPNLLALRAYYLGPKGEKLLALDYMPKGSLATFLHDLELQIR
ncbi:putative leucine-rich repeat receptor-like protein kinase imk3 [Orobanche gracilis]